MELQSVDNSVSCRFFSEQPMRTLVDIPIEVLVYIVSFVISARDKVKLRYTSRLLRTVVETPSLWRDFIWPYFDFREERAIKSVLKSCGRHVKRLIFPSIFIPAVESMQYCDNVLRLSLPSVKLSISQLRTVMQCMKKLQYIDILWTSLYDIKHLLLMVGYPVYNYTIKEIMIRESVKDSSFDEAVFFLLNEWTALHLIPRTINIVTHVGILFGEVLEQWMNAGIPRPAGHIGILNVYIGNFSCSVDMLPFYQYQIFGLHCVNPSFVLARNYGMLGLTNNDYVLLSSCTTGNGDVLHRGRLSSGNIQGTPLNIVDIKFLTDFSAMWCDFFYSGHLEQLAIACPNLRLLDLHGNVNCLKSLQGLCMIATSCQKLENLIISNISIDKVENRLQLWKILVDLDLIYLRIDVCCLLCFEGDDDNAKQIIISLHQKCLKLRSLDSRRYSACAKCIENTQPLLLSNFPLLIQSTTSNIGDVIICERLRRLSYKSSNIWWPWSIENCNLRDLYINSSRLVIPDSFMMKVSAHGGLVHVILNVHSVTSNGMAALIENSPSLIVFHVFFQTEFDWLISLDSDFRSTLKKKYSARKLFWCGSYRLVKEEKELFETKALDNLEFIPF